jgi:hypothetical protein
MTTIIDFGVIEKLLGNRVKDTIPVKIKGKYYFFDKESLLEFEKFKKTHVNLQLEDEYINAELKENVDITHFFHVWLMRDEIEKEKSPFPQELEVHHITFCKRINMKGFLKVVTKKKHKILHSGNYHGIRFNDNEKWLIDFYNDYYSKNPLNVDCEEI